MWGSGPSLSLSIAASQPASRRSQIMIMSQIAGRSLESQSQYSSSENY